MDPLASSHTRCSRKGRRFLVMFIALMLFRHSITTVVGASASGSIPGVGSPADSLAWFRIRGGPARPNDPLQRSGTERTLASEISSTRLLGDISPPGLWPTPDDQDPAPDTHNEFRRRSLLTGTTFPQPLGPWFVVMHSSEDGEDVFLRQALVAEKTYPLVPLALMMNKLKQLGTVLISQGFRIFLPGSLRKNTAVNEDSLEQIEHGDQQFPERVVPDAFDSSPDSVFNELRSSTEHSEDSVSRSPQKEFEEEIKFPRRGLLQGDISPPGMWSDPDDDESQVSESVVLRRRGLLNLPTKLAGEFKSPIRRSLQQGDISPPGMWPDVDDGESQISEALPLLRRRLLNMFRGSSLRM